ncbi:MAG: hypothetical protein KatS3mg101_0421 [Patescibacteria group bacterium]|nr:MAG: hypothetical protein KatS3mg101_0421 [Patescibacteria group bacterium]
MRRLLKDSRLRAASGFTLIELLLVIVIIGILAGVLIAVINPTAQQNKARDANTRATINKVALATSAYVSAFGRIPDENEFVGGLSSVTTTGTPAPCTTANDASCTFQVANNPLPTGGTAGCAANGWNGSGANQCYYYYCGGDAADFTNCAWAATTSNYRIMAKAFGSSDMFMYRSSDSKMYLCNPAGTTCTALY